MRWPSLAFWCLRVTAGTKITISSTINFQEYFYRDPAKMLHGFLHYGYFWFSAPAIQCQNCSKPVPRGFLLLCKYYKFWTELSVPYLGYFTSFKTLLLSIASRFFGVVAVFIDIELFLSLNFECLQIIPLQQSGGWRFSDDLNLLQLRKGNTIQNTLQKYKLSFSPNNNSF